MDIIGFGQVAPERIKQFEKNMGFKLPEDYYQFLLNQNGGEPRIKYAAFKISSINQYSSLDVLLGINIDNFDLIKRNQEYKEDLLPNSLIIGDDPGSGMILLFYDQKNHGIYYWDHSFDFSESSPEHNIYKISDSFNDFIYGLLDPNSI